MQEVPVPPASMRDSLAGHLALARRLGAVRTIDERSRLLAAQIAAERSGCRWCIELGRHDWRRAGLPLILLRRLDELGSSPLLTARERAACRFALAVACAREALPDRVFADARRHLTEHEIADLVGCLADHHCLDDTPG